MVQLSSVEYATARLTALSIANIDLTSNQVFPFVLEPFWVGPLPLISHSLVDIPPFTDIRE